MATSNWDYLYYGVFVLNGILWSFSLWMLAIGQFYSPVGVVIFSTWLSAYSWLFYTGLSSIVFLVLFIVSLWRNDRTNKSNWSSIRFTSFLGFVAYFVAFIFFVGIYVNHQIPLGYLQRNPISEVTTASFRDFGPTPLPAFPMTLLNVNAELASIRATFNSQSKQYEYYSAFMITLAFVALATSIIVAKSCASAYDVIAMKEGKAGVDLNLEKKIAKKSNKTLF
jgi:hypothetical protein